MLMYVGVAAIMLAAIYSMICKARPYCTVRESLALLVLASSFAAVHYLASRGDARWWSSLLNALLMFALIYCTARITVAEIRRNGMGRLERYRARSKR
jgi:hypothetical protein